MFKVNQKNTRTTSLVSKINASMFPFLKSVHIVLIQNDLFGSQPVMDANTF